MSAQAGKTADGSIARTVQLDTRNTPVDTFVSWAQRGDLDLDAPYQRGSVWAAERQRNLIRSLVIGLPIGAIFINDRGVLNPFVIIDGKQRIEAILAWYAGNFAVPSAWFPTDHLTAGAGEHVTYQKLTLKGQRLFTNSSAVATYTSHFTGPSAVELERDLFELINNGGVPQGQDDRSNQ